MLKIDLDNYLYEDKKGDTYFNANVSDETCFRKDKDKTTNTISSEKTKYNCRILLQIQSVCYNNKDMLEDIAYLSSSIATGL